MHRTNAYYWLIIVLVTSSLVGVHCQKNNFTITKCSCQWYQIQEENGDCINHNDTYVYVMGNATVGSDTFVHLRDVSNVTVGPPVCPSRYHMVVQRGLALLSSTGDLLPFPEPATDNFCVENFAPVNGSLDQRYQYCVTYDPFPVCCPPTESVHTFEDCGEPLDAFAVFFRYIVQDVECTNGTSIHRMLLADTNTVGFTYLKEVFGYYDDTPAATNESACLGTSFVDGQTYFFVKYCQPDEQLSRISHCCLGNESYNVQTKSCEATAALYTPTHLNYSQEETAYMLSLPMCDEFHVLNFDHKIHTVLRDGSLSPETGDILPQQSFCLGLVTNGDVIAHTGLACTVDRPEEPCAFRFVIVQVFLSISTVFIILTIAVYASIKELRNRTGGACLISELVAILVSQVNLIIIHDYSHTFSGGNCLAVGVIELIFVLATFFWLNVMCYDMWTTFRTTRSFCPKLMNMRRFVKYSLYAWGVPIVIGLIVVAVELLDLDYRPMFTPEQRCFFNSNDSELKLQWIYLYGFILLILLVNTFFFVQVTMKLSSVKMQGRKLVKGNTKDNADLNMALENSKLYGKLFVIMGIPWLIEVGTSFAPGSSYCYIWVLDTINLLRGVIIFIIFVCKQSTRIKITQRWTSSRLVNETLGSQRSRKTSVISLTWLSSRKVSTHPSATPAGEDGK